MGINQKLLATALICSAAVPALAQAQTAPAAIGRPVILSGARMGEAVRQKPAVRSYTFEALRAQPIISLGTHRINMAPMFNNPHSLVNMAGRLAKLPQHLQVTLNTSEVKEVAEGLVIHNELSYHILPGQCTNPASRQAIVAAGAHCLSRIPLNAHLAAFSQPGAKQFIADPARRAQAIAKFQSNYLTQEAQVNKNIADLRARLANPATRAQFVAKAGEAEVRRVSMLTDEQIKDEATNSASIRMTETLFVPRNPSATPRENVRAMGLAKNTPYASQPVMAGLQTTATNHQAYTMGVTQAQPGSGGSPAQSTTPSVEDKDLGTDYWLTGFTIAHNYEWTQTFGGSINPCVLFDCTLNFYVTPYAGFEYGFGMRFPIETQLHYHREVAANGTAQATVTATTIQPIAGTSDQWQKTGLDMKDYYFNGQELVAQAYAYAGLDYDISGLGTKTSNPPDQVDVKIGQDFTQFLPVPFKGGHFTPPTPGQGPTWSDPYIFTQLDLLNGYGNFGVIGAQVYPALRFGLSSNALTFNLTDAIGGQTTQISAPGQVVPVATSKNHFHSTDFSLSNPNYNLELDIEPGIDLHLFINLAVWSDSWDPILWFPQLEVKIPDGGITFHCHDGTICAREYQPDGDHKAAMDVAGYTPPQYTEDQIRNQAGAGNGGCQDTSPDGVNHQMICATPAAVNQCKAMTKGLVNYSCTLNQAPAANQRRKVN